MAIKTLSPVAPLAALDLVTQAAAVGSTVLYAVPATQGGLYQVRVYLKVTRAATTSSTLGGVTVTFTDATDIVAQSVTAALQTVAGASATSATTNNTTTVLLGTVVVNAKAGTNISILIGYASTGGTTMQYEAHFNVVQ